MRIDSAIRVIKGLFMILKPLKTTRLIGSRRGNLLEGEEEKCNRISKQRKRSKKKEREENFNENK